MLMLSRILFTLSMFRIILPLARITTAIRICYRTHAVLAIIFEAAFVYGIVGIYHFTVAISAAVDPATCVFSIVWPSISSFTLPRITLPLAIVTVTVRIIHFSLSMSFAVEPVTLVSTLVLKSHHSFAISLVLVHFPDIL